MAVFMAKREIKKCTDTLRQRRNSSFFNTVSNFELFSNLLLFPGNVFFGRVAWNINENASKMPQNVQQALIFNLRVKLWVIKRTNNLNEKIEKSLLSPV